LVEKKKKSVLSKIIGFFQNSDYHAYLVGGCVRDLIMGRDFFDVDIAIEGNIVKSLEEMNRQIKGRTILHRDFGTGSIITENYRIDFCHTRREKYPAPAKLPKVYFATIYDDIKRRDFTINAIAISISRGDFGEILDPFNGLRDIKNRIIRILYKKSFIDDPTRIFRALRYKNRFDFQLEKETEQLLSEAVNKGMINFLTGQRILNEIKLIFAEKTYQKTLSDLSRFNIFKIDKKDLARLHSLRDQRIYFFLSKLPYEELPLKKNEMKIVNDFRRYKIIAKKLAHVTKNSAIYNTLSPISDRVVNEIPFLYPALKKKIKVYKQLRNIKPFIKGDDLKSLGFIPGKKFKYLLKKLRNHQLDKKMRARKEAVEYLKKLKER